MSGSCGLTELCCDMMVGPSYCVPNNGFVRFSPLTVTHGHYYSYLVL